jgi:hypothetical protein
MGVDVAGKPIAVVMIVSPEMRLTAAVWRSNIGPK